MTESGWTPIPGAEVPAERLEFESLDFLDELANPVRARIMRRLREASSIAELASALDVPVTRLYHHINRLESAGMIRVVATRQVGAVTERRYQVVARSFAIASKFFDSHDSDEVAAALGSLFDLAKMGFQRQVEGGRIDFDDETTSILSFGHLTLTDDRRTELVERLAALADEFGNDPKPSDGSAGRVALFVAAHPDAD